MMDCFIKCATRVHAQLHPSFLVWSKHGCSATSCKNLLLSGTPWCPFGMAPNRFRLSGITSLAATGSRADDLWLVNGTSDLAWLSPKLLRSVLENQTDSVPVRLHVGNLAYGQRHIEHRHGHWLNKHGTNAQMLVWQKLQHPAQVYLSDKKGGLKLSFRFAPEALMVLEWRQTCFSVVTLYSHPQHTDGQPIGRYRPSKTKDF
jgi:hypothetical protein